MSGTFYAKADQAAGVREILSARLLRHQWYELPSDSGGSEFDIAHDQFIQVLAELVEFITGEPFNPEEIPIVYQDKEQS